MVTKEISVTIGFNDLFRFTDSDSTKHTQFNIYFEEIIELLNIENNIKELHQDFLHSNKNWNEGDIVVYSSEKKAKLILDLAIEGDGYDLIFVGCIYDSSIKKDVVSLFRNLFDNSTLQIEYVESMERLASLVNIDDFPRKRNLGNNIEYEQNLIHFVSSNKQEKEEISHKISWHDLTQTLDKCQIASLSNQGISELNDLLSKLKYGPIKIQKNMDLIILRDKSDLQNIIDTYDSNIRL